MRDSSRRAGLAVILAMVLALAMPGAVVAETWGLGYESCSQGSVTSSGYDKGSAKKEHWGHMITTSKSFPYSPSYKFNLFQDSGRAYISGGQAWASVDVYSLNVYCL